MGVKLFYYFLAMLPYVEGMPTIGMLRRVRVRVRVRAVPTTGMLRRVRVRVLFTINTRRTPYILHYKSPQRRHSEG